jgi:deoxycytidylate deaminase
MECNRKIIMLYIKWVHILKQYQNSLIKQTLLKNHTDNRHNLSQNWATQIEIILDSHAWF